MSYIVGVGYQVGENDIALVVQMAAEAFLKKYGIKATKLQLPKAALFVPDGLEIISRNGNNMVIAGVSTEEWNERGKS